MSNNDTCFSLQGRKKNYYKKNLLQSNLILPVI